MKKYEEALSNYHECLGIKEEAVGKMHPSYATTLNNIGLNYHHMGEYREALKTILIAWKSGKYF